ncbi:MAG: aldehyde dehydrogenase family protein [Actinomycetota bacterium]|nr:aldehyde dehydrogenase family protein [Actinomycetota bacterium]
MTTSPTLARRATYVAEEGDGPVRLGARLGAGRKSPERLHDVRNPYDGRTLASVSTCAEADVWASCEEAERHLDDDFPQFQRSRVLSSAALLLSESQNPFARIIALEAGKPIRAARAEVARCIDTLRLSAAEALALSGEVVPMDATAASAGRLGLALRVPIGVVGAITPFNFPLNLVAHKVAPAIAAGCPVVLKPAPATPLSALAFADLLADAGLPDGWLSVVTGARDEIGAALVAHRVPRLISFTGSCTVGWSIASAAPDKRVCLELGANTPVIVEPDVDVDAVAERVSQAAFGYAGQSCISIQRVLVHERIANDLSAALATRARHLVVGDPLDELTDVGPVINAASAQRILSSVREATDGGARVLAGGEANGNLVAPTVLEGAPRDGRLWSEEIFGPVVLVNAYADFDAALSMANQSDLGLHAGIFTNDLSKALDAARRLRFGGVLVNDVPTFRADQEPYGGVRASGNTREGPRYAVESMTELRFVSFAAPPR